MSAPRLSEDDLQAYVDHRLPPAQRMAVERALGEDAEASARVTAYQNQTALLQAAFDPVLDEPLPTALVHAGLRPRPRRWPLVAAFLLVLMAGMALGWVGRQVSHAPAMDVGNLAQLSRQAIGAHRIYAAEGRHAVEVSAQDEAHLVSWLSKRVGSPLMAPGLAQAGFTLIGGRLVAEGKLPVALFLYEDPDGHRVSVYVRSCDGAGDTAFRFARDGTTSAFYWVEGPLAFALIGDLPRDTLARLSRLVYDELPFALGQNSKG